MTNPAIIGLGHLDFTVTDGDRAVRWWQEVMGFRLLAEWGHEAFFAESLYGRGNVPMSGDPVRNRGRT